MGLFSYCKGSPCDETLCCHQDLPSEAHPTLACPSEGSAGAAENLHNKPCRTQQKIKYTSAGEKHELCIDAERLERQSFPSLLTGVGFQNDERKEGQQTFVGCAEPPRLYGLFASDEHHQIVSDTVSHARDSEERDQIVFNTVSSDVPLDEPEAQRDATLNADMNLGNANAKHLNTSENQNDLEGELSQVDAFLKKHSFRNVNHKRRSMLRSCYPLHVAVKEIDEEMVKLLLKGGADASRKNSSGQTPEALAEKINKSGSHLHVLLAFREGDPEAKTGEKIAVDASQN